MSLMVAINFAIINWSNDFFLFEQALIDRLLFQLQRILGIFLAIIVHGKRIQRVFTYHDVFEDRVSCIRSPFPVIVIVWTPTKFVVVHFQEWLECLFEQGRLVRCLKFALDLANHFIFETSVSA